MNDTDLDRLLKHSLASSVEPEEQLNQTIINQLKEHGGMKSKGRKRISVALLAAVLLLVMSMSVYPATQLFSSKQVAEHVGDQLLADAFDSEDAIHINQSKASGDYNFTLHGLVSGAGLSEFKHSSEEVYPDRTYAVVSITRQDGKPMPKTSDVQYGKDPFFISPLIKGEKPWMVNIVTMNGAYSETVIDGVMYRLIECDQVEIFADRGVYLAISNGSSFFSNKAFAYDERSGEITVQEDYEGAAVLFDLPLDVARADHNKAEEYLKTLLDPTTTDDEESSNAISSNDEEEWVTKLEAVRAKIRAGQSIGETIADSIQEVEFDDMGNIVYRFDDGRTNVIIFDELFQEGQVGFSEYFTVSGRDDISEALVFHRDEDGVITSRIIVLDEVIF